MSAAIQIFSGLLDLISILLLWKTCNSFDTTGLNLGPTGPMMQRKKGKNNTLFSTKMQCELAFHKGT